MVNSTIGRCPPRFNHERTDRSSVCVLTIPTVTLEIPSKKIAALALIWAADHDQSFSPQATCTSLSATSPSENESRPQSCCQNNGGRTECSPDRFGHSCSCRSSGCGLSLPSSQPLSWLKFAAPVCYLGLLSIGPLDFLVCE